LFENGTLLLLLSERVGVETHGEPFLGVFAFRLFFRFWSTFDGVNIVVVVVFNAK
jgi:hypothetical protein